MFDCVIITIAHNHFKELSIDDIEKITKKPPVLVDIRCIFDSGVARGKGFIYRSL